MKTKLIEVTNGELNWGKFMLGRPDVEWLHRSAVETEYALLGATGWTTEHLWVMDLQTGEGAYFVPGGHAGADLQKHRIWVCPMYEPFLTWLYKQDLSDLDALPALVNFSQEEAPFAMQGYRRSGSETG